MPAPWRAQIPRLLLVGVVGGLLSGLFGIGGGVVMVPLLIVVARMDERRAAATSLAAIVPAAVAGVVTYGVNGEVNYAAGGLVAAGAVVGAYLGARLLRRISLSALRWGFILLLLATAVRMFLLVPDRGESLVITLATGAQLVGLGLAAGVASGLFGIGGGVIIVPALIALIGVSDLVAKGTSLLAVLPAALTGTATNVRGHVVRLTPALVVGLAAATSASGGAALALEVPPRLSAVLFGLLLVASATQLTVRAVKARRHPPQG